MTSPAFATEMNTQIDLARQELEIAVASGDDDAAAAAAARLEDLAEVTRRHGVDVHQVAPGTTADGEAGRWPV